MATKPSNPMSDFPKTIGAAIDLLFTLRAQRLEAQKSVDAMEAKEGALRAHLMANFKGSDIDGAKGKVATASIMRSNQAEITDFEAFVKWAVKKKAYACLRKQVGITAVREYWDNKEVIPGLEVKPVETLSLTKVGS